MRSDVAVACVGGRQRSGGAGGIGGACADWQRHIRVPVAGFVPHTPDCPIGHGSGHCESLVHALRLGIGGGGVSFWADAESAIAAARHSIFIISSSADGPPRGRGRGYAILNGEVRYPPLRASPLASTVHNPLGRTWNHSGGLHVFRNFWNFSPESGRIFTGVR